MTQAQSRHDGASGSGDARERRDWFLEQWQKISEAIGRVIVGNDEAVHGILSCLVSGGHVLLEGVPGLGKTLLAKTLAQALDLSFKRIQFTPDLMPADITGTMIVSEVASRRSLTFQPGPLFANLVLADEINRATPKTQSALLEAMGELSVTVAGDRHAMADPFLVIGTQNPIEMEGTYPLPEAQLDRFQEKLLVSFPSLDELSAIVDRTTGSEVASTGAVAGTAEILEMRRIVRRTLVAMEVKDYVLKLILALHPENEEADELIRRSVRFGPSPRGAQAVILAAKVQALVAGRCHVAFEDVRSVLKPSLRHRLLLSFEGEGEGILPDDLIDQAVRTTSELSKKAEQEAAYGGSRS